ncbi:MAG: hypothetical protein JRC99_11480 [Deltaproteobacteria bacterium]|nr:hypothetical protein [Deltaproteobacteria bacterium]
MSGIRLADIPDIDEITKLGMELLNQSVYAGIKPDVPKFRMLVAGLIGSKLSVVYVITDDNDKPQGFFLGIIDDLFFSRQRVATDLAVYVRKAFRSQAPKMFRMFIKWAKSKPRVAEISFGISSGIGNVDRVGRMYENLGLTHVGGIYRMGV